MSFTSWKGFSGGIRNWLKMQQTVLRAAHWEAGLEESSKKSATGALPGSAAQLPLEHQRELELSRQHRKNGEALPAQSRENQHLW